MNHGQKVTLNGYKKVLSGFKYAYCYEFQVKRYKGLLNFLSYDFLLLIFCPTSDFPYRPVGFSCPGQTGHQIPCIRNYTIGKDWLKSASIAILYLSGGNPP